jgi:hypothetical protein
MTAPAGSRARRGGLTLAALGRRVSALERASRRFDLLLRCTRAVGVDQAGDPAHRFGFRYDERDGSGLDRRPALVLHRGGGRPDLRLLTLARTRRCLSAAPDPMGTARPARARTAAVRGADLAALRRRTRAIERRAKRFDRWESCLTRLPVTEAGDPAQDLGYLRAAGAAGGARHDAAIDLDTSAQDDPDYELLAFVGADRPFTRSGCDADPGEGFSGLRRAAAPRDAPTPTPTRRELAEDVDDLEQPVGAITRFD